MSNHSRIQASELLKHTRVMSTRGKGVKEQFFTDDDRVWLCENLIEAVKENVRLKQRLARMVKNAFED